MSLERADTIMLRQNLFGLPWCKRPEAVRYRAVNDLREMWNEDLVTPAKRCLKEAMEYFENGPMTDDASPLGHLSNRISDPLSRAFVISRVASSLAKEKRNVVEAPEEMHSFRDRTRSCIDNMQRLLRNTVTEKNEEESEKVPKSLLFVRAKSHVRSSRSRQRLDKENSREGSGSDNTKEKMRDQKEFNNNNNTAPKSLLFVKSRSRLNFLARPRGPITKKRENSKREAWR